MARFAVFLAALVASAAAATLEVPAAATDSASPDISTIAEPAGILTEDRAEELIKKGYTITEVTPEQAGSGIAASEIASVDAAAAKMLEEPIGAKISVKEADVAKVIPASEFPIFEKPTLRLRERADQAILESAPIYSGESSRFIPSEFPIEKSSFRLSESASAPIYSEGSRFTPSELSIENPSLFRVGESSRIIPSEFPIEKSSFRLSESSKFIPSQLSIEKPSFRLSELSRIVPNEFPIEKSSFRLSESSAPIFSSDSSRFVPSSYSIEEPTLRRRDFSSAPRYVERPPTTLDESAFDGARIIPSGFSLEAPSMRNWEYSSAPRYSIDESSLLRSASRIVEKPSFRVSEASRIVPDEFPIEKSSFRLREPSRIVPAEFPIEKSSFRLSESSPVFSSDSSRFIPSSYSFEEPTIRSWDSSSKIIRRPSIKTLV